jgi:hypothetical protein
MYEELLIFCLITSSCWEERVFVILVFGVFNCYIEKCKGVIEPLEKRIKDLEKCMKKQ